MKVFISTSASFYDRVESVIRELESMGHEVIPPNGYGESLDESVIKQAGGHQVWKAGMLRRDIELVKSSDVIVVLNYAKNGQENYVGASAFLELFKAFELDLKRFLLNPIPAGALADELSGMSPVILHNDLSLVC